MCICSCFVCVLLYSRYNNATLDKLISGPSSLTCYQLLNLMPTNLEPRIIEEKKAKEKPPLALIYTSGMFDPFSDDSIAKALSLSHNVECFELNNPVYDSCVTFLKKLRDWLKSVDSPVRVDVLLMVPTLRGQVVAVDIGNDPAARMKLREIFAFISLATRNCAVNIVVVTQCANDIEQDDIKWLGSGAIVVVQSNPSNAKRVDVCLKKWLECYRKVWRLFPNLSWIETMYLLYGRYIATQDMAPLWISESRVENNDLSILYSYIEEEKLLEGENASIKLMITDEMIPDLKTALQTFNDVRNRSPYPVDEYLSANDRRTMNTLIFFSKRMRSQFKRVLNASDDVDN